MQSSIVRLGKRVYLKRIFDLDLDEFDEVLAISNRSLADFGARFRITRQIITLLNI
jgi:hypothetical protein